MSAHMIRLGVEAAAAPPLETHPVIRAVGGESRHGERNVIHLDTLNRKLRRNGVSLILSRDGLEWTQAIARGDPDAATRSWRRGAVKNSRLDLALLKKLDKERLLSGVNVNKLKPLFVLHVQERAWTLAFPGGETLSLREERGYLLIGGVRQPFHEVVLESRDGGPGTRLFEIALGLAYHLQAVTLLCAGPVARGFAQLDATPPLPPSNRWLEVLDRDTTIQEGFVSLGGALLGILQEGRVVATHGGSGTRWAGFRRLLWSVDRLRTLIALYHAYLPGEIAAGMDDEVRWLQEELTRIRDWQRFFRSTLEPLIGQFPFHAGLEALHSRGDARCEVAFGAAAASLGSFRCARLLLGMAQWMGAGDQHLLLDQPQRQRMAAPVIDLARESLARHTMALDGRDRNLAVMDAGERRALRQDVERLTHTVDLFSSLFRNRRVKPFQEALEALSKSMALLDDTTVGGDLFLQLLEPGEAPLEPLLQGWQGARSDRFVRDSEKAWQAFLACPPFWS